MGFRLWKTKHEIGFLKLCYASLFGSLQGSWFKMHWFWFSIGVRVSQHVLQRPRPLPIGASLPSIEHLFVFWEKRPERIFATADPQRMASDPSSSKACPAKPDCSDIGGEAAKGPIWPQPTWAWDASNEEHRAAILWTRVRKTASSRSSFRLWTWARFFRTRRWRRCRRRSEPTAARSWRFRRKASIGRWLVTGFECLNEKSPEFEFCNILRHEVEKLATTSKGSPWHNVNFTWSK